MTQEFTFQRLFGRITRRITAAATVFFFSFTFYSPAVQAAYEVMTSEYQPAVNKLENISPLGHELAQLQKNVSAVQSLLQQTEIDTALVTKAVKRIKAQYAELVDLDEQQRQQFEQERLQLAGNDLPETILARQQSFEQSYTANMDAILQLAEQLGSVKAAGIAKAETLSLANSLAEHLQYPVSAPRQSFGSDLDFVDAPPRNIYSTPAQLRRLLGIGTDTTWEDSAWLATDAATASSERINDLINTIGTDPVALYNWVHDNLRYIPSYGVMQGADYTLQTEQGNAFDISSALIALYRAAGIPARYQYGIVTLPPEQVQNWVGGVVNVNAATNLLSQGGIPQLQLTYGGATEEIQMEHVWVQAEVDGQWVSLDPSFKQYTYTDGMDLQTVLPLDTTALLDELQASGTRNEEEGWVQGVDPTIIQNALTNYQNELEDYFTNQQPNATLGDVLGQQVIIPSEAVSLADISLPYTRIIARESVPQLPQSLFYQFKLQIGNTTGGTFGLPIQWGGVAAELSDVTPNLIGHNLAISFRPATTADEQTLLSYLPENIEAVDDLPTSLPANTVRMIGEITKDGEVVAQTGEVTLGQSLMTRLGYTAPQRNWSYSENYLDAGVYQALGLDMQGVSPAQLEALQARLQNTQTILDNANESELGSLTKHDLVGDILQTGIQGYLAETYAMDKLSAQAADIVTYREPSYGTFSTAMEVAYFFGTPRTVNFTGVVMDVDRIKANTESKDNCYDDWLAFNRSSGMRSSAYEHIIPERLFSTEENPAEGVSTAKALSLAMAQGQKIYTLTTENKGQLANITIDDNALSEISQALSIGLEVTVHERPINVNGWEGSGYSIIDTDYGVGAYKISGGANGGFLLFIGLVSLLMIGVFIIASGGAGLLAASPAILAAVSISLGNITKGLSLILEATGNAGYLSSAMCNLASYFYSSGAFALLGLVGVMRTLLSLIWVNFAAGGVATALLTPLCT